MPQHTRIDPPRPASATAAVSSPLTLHAQHRRLVRYLYAAPLLRGRRVLEIGGNLGGEGEAMTRLVERGARSVASTETDRLESLRAFSGGPFDLIFLEATPQRCTPAFLAEVRRLLVPGGHVLASARSKEAAATAPEAVGYFQLLDSLTTAGLGPVTMLGQSLFLGATMTPYETAEPALLFDDTLVAPGGAEEYVALCGAPPASGLAYQVVKLPHEALERPVATVEKLVTQPVEVKVLDPQIVAERDQHKARAEELAQKLEQLGATLRTTEGQRSELSERLKQRSLGENEGNQAALVHERQMRELQKLLEERDAFVAELEQQARELPRLQEQLATSQRQCEESQRSERHTRQKLAEVEGLLLRARAELKERERLDAQRSGTNFPVL